MARYVFSAIEDGGRIASGIIEAQTKDDAFKTLSEKFGVVTEINEIKKIRGFFEMPISGEDVMVFSQQLATMLRASMILPRALEIIAADTENKRLQGIIAEIASGVTKGQSLSSQMARFPEIFSRVYLSLVEAGELSGKLPEILKKLADHLESDENLKRKVKAAFYYPVTVVIIALIISAFIFLFGVRQFQEIYAGLGAKLPPLTEFTIGVGNFIWNYWVIVVALMLFVIYLIKRFLATTTGQYARDRFLFNAPVLGPIMKRLGIAYFSRTLSVLYSSGVPILQSLELLAGGTGNRIMGDVIKKTLKDVTEGESITAPLRKSGVFTRMAIGMIATGEESGTLVLMLEEIANFYEVQVDVMLRAMTTIIEPIVIVFLGIFVGFLIISLGLPLLNLVQALS